MSYNSQEEYDMQIRSLAEHIKCKNCLHSNKPGKVFWLIKDDSCPLYLPKNLNATGIH